MHILAAAEFLPTNETPFVNPGILMLLLCVTIFATFAFLGRSAWGTIISTVCLVSLIFAVGFSVYGSTTAYSQNSKNLEKNISQIYDVDDVAIPSSIPAGFFENDRLENGQLQVEVTRDGKTYQMYLSQDSETFEPELAPMESPEDFDEWLKDSDK